jgi:hypothetical protein
MKNALLAIVLTVCLTAGANAHQGMLALFADTNNRECHTALGVGQIGNLYLMYVRGDGPRMGNAYEFKLLNSTAGVAFLPPVWPSSIITPMIFGTIETGISLVRQDCFEDQDYVPLGTIPIMNISDPDTFTVKVVEAPNEVDHLLLITLCNPYADAYVVLGGMFVFNAGCSSPEDPFGVVATKATTWGAVKDLYR